jgi:hypothetical protein
MCMVKSQFLMYEICKFEVYVFPVIKSLLFWVSKPAGTFL